MTDETRRNEVFSRESEERAKLLEAFENGTGTTELDHRKREWCSAVEQVFAYLVTAATSESRLAAIDFEFFGVMRGMFGNIVAGSLPEPLSIAARQGSPATALERHDIGNAIIYLLAAGDPISPISNAKPRKIIARRYGVSPRTASNWRERQDYYLAGREVGPERLRGDWLNIIVEMKSSGRRYSQNKKAGKRRTV